MISSVQFISHVKVQKLPWLTDATPMLIWHLGDDGSTDYQFRNTKPSAKAKSPLQGICQEWRDRFRVYFPSSQTVDAVARAAGRRSQDIGGTVCFSSKYWYGPKFPGQILRDCHSQRDVLMHNKVRQLASLRWKSAHSV